MKRLILMRHAKSSWADAGQRDEDRPLNGRGRRDAPEMGDWLVGAGRVPDAALVSSARRAQETWALLGPSFAAAPMTPRADLYLAGPEALLAALRGAPEVGAVLLLGHQPGIGASARMLLAEAPGDPVFAKYPTSATAVIEFAVDAWTEVAWGAGRLAAFAAPGTLG